MNAGAAQPVIGISGDAYQQAIEEAIAGKFVHTTTGGTLRLILKRAKELSTRPAESVAQGGEDLQALADAVSITNATGNESLFIPAVQNLVDAVRKLRPTPATGSGGEA